MGMEKTNSEIPKHFVIRHLPGIGAKPLSSSPSSIYFVMKSSFNFTVGPAF